MNYCKAAFESGESAPPRDKVKLIKCPASGLWPSAYRKLDIRFSDRGGFS